MKAPQQRCQTADTSARSKLRCSKMESLKPGRYTHKSSGKGDAKCSGGATHFPVQSYSESQTILKGSSFMEKPFDNSKKLSARPPNLSGKIKLQLFPINEVIQKVLQQEKRNPYLELTLAPRKKISSVVQHLNTKWGSSQCARGELMLCPYNARLDSIVGSEKWTLQDSCTTAADVYVAVGSPSTFRLRYGWFEPNYEEQICGASVSSPHSENKSSREDVPPQTKMLNLSKLPCNIAVPSVVDNTVQTVDNQTKVAPLSWIDSISNVSFGALLSETAPSQDGNPLPSQNNLNLQQIPVMCDSFDVAIASLIARQQGSSQLKESPPSLWNAEDTCCAFPLQNQTSIRTSSPTLVNNALITSPIPGANPESGKVGDQQCFMMGEVTEGRKEEMSSSGNKNVGKTDVSLPESAGQAEPTASCSRLMSGTDSLGLGSLLGNSLDTFQNFSIF